MGEIVDILIDFDKWCPSCKYARAASIDYPCDECLEHATNVRSEKPVKYEEADNK